MSGFAQRMQQKRNQEKRKGISLACGIFLFLCCFGVYFLSQTEWVQKDYLYPYPYRETVEHYADIYGVDSSLAAGVIQAESRFRADVQSHRGAVGLMQLMPDTAEWIAGQMGDQRYSVVSLSDPEVNIRYGIWYLAVLQKEFDGNDILALAAYNAGRGNVQSWMRLYGWRQDFSDVEKIPYAETREYVLRVLRYQKKYEDLYERSSTGVLTASIENR